jgi:hypothetical protein
MSIGSMPAAASVASVIIPMGLADLCSSLMTSPSAHPRQGWSNRLPSLISTVVNRFRPHKAGMSRSERDLGR